MVASDLLNVDQFLCFENKTLFPHVLDHDFLTQVMYFSFGKLDSVFPDRTLTLAH